MKDQNWWIWLIGIAVALVFWQELALLAIVVGGALVEYEIYVSKWTTETKVLLGIACFGIAAALFNKVGGGSSTKVSGPTGPTGPTRIKCTNCVNGRITCYHTGNSDRVCVQCGGTGSKSCYVCFGRGYL